MIDDALFYLLTSDMVQKIGFSFLVGVSLILSLVYYWRCWK